MANISERMARKKQFKNESNIPDDQIEMIANALMQSIYDYWDSSEGKSAYEEYVKSNQSGAVITCVNTLPELSTAKI